MNNNYITVKNSNAAKRRSQARNITGGETMKQNARNNEFLAEVKKVVNEKIYAKVLSIYNEKGYIATIEYLNQFFNWQAIEKMHISPSYWYYTNNNSR